MSNMNRLRQGVIAAVITATLSAGPQARQADYRVETLVEGLNHPYSLAFLPQGDMLVTEKSGALRLIRQGTLVPEPVAVLPDVYDKGQGALTDVVVHPRFAENQLVYLAYSAGSAKANGTKVVKGRFIDDQLQDIEAIFRARPDKDTGAHFGARMVFLKDETLLITVGDGAQYREKAQDLSSMLGSIIRIGDDGSVPRDNPFVGRTDALPEIWSYGHRNPQGIIHDPQADRVYSTEHGPRGGDELNLVEAGKNYGWPLATYGVDYTGAAISPYQEYQGTEQPLTHWTPSLAPSGLAQCRSCQWPQWEGDIFAGILKGTQVQRVRLLDNGEVEREGLFEEVGERIRDVRFGPDGALYLVTDNVKGRVLKVVPDTP